MVSRLQTKIVSLSLRFPYINFIDKNLHLLYELHDARTFFLMRVAECQLKKKGKLDARKKGNMKELLYNDSNNNNRKHMWWWNRRVGIGCLSICSSNRSILNRYQ